MIAKPVKCIPSVTRTSFLLHSLAFAWNCFGIYNDRTYYILPIFNAFGGRFQYLTMITAYVNLITTGIAFLVDLIQMSTGILESTKPTKSGYQLNQSYLLTIRDDLMSFWMFTLSTFVVIMFWGIAAVDLDGLMPPAHRKITPLLGWYNQYLHTIPVIIAFILILSVNYDYGSMKKALFYAVLLGTSYLSWMTYLAKINGYWAYDFLEKLNQQQYVVFILLSYVVLFGIYVIGRLVSSRVWDLDRHDKILINLERKGL